MSVPHFGIDNLLVIAGSTMILVTGAPAMRRAVVFSWPRRGRNGQNIQAASRGVPSRIALRVADYQVASALKRAPRYATL